MYYSGYGYGAPQAGFQGGAQAGYGAYGFGCCEPVCCPRGNNTYAMILVLFILLVIIGCTCYRF